MKTMLYVFSFLALTSTASAAEATFQGIYDTNAAIMTEALLESAKTNPNISIDDTVYTVIKVTSTDAMKTTVQCSKFHFGGTPAQYFCSIETAP